MSKIQARAGASLADVYDVVGSIAGIDELISKEVHLTHEMGAAIFSERFSQNLRRVTTGAIAQNITFGVVLTDVPATPARVHQVLVQTDNVSRLTDVAVVLRDSLSGREIPIWVWDGTNSTVVVFDDDGAGPGPEIVLEPIVALLGYPTLVTGAEQPQRVDQIALRGLTSGFGAGTVTVAARYLLSFAEVQGVSSLGLPIPSW